MRIKKKAFKTDSIARAYDWLHKVYISPQYSHMKAAWALCTPETWKHYKALGFKDMPEITILDKASLDLRTLWRCNRPFVFGANNAKKQNNH